MSILLTTHRYGYEIALGTTTKALKLLEQLTAAEPALGLSAIARRAKVEKATTYRLMAELCAAGFAEQNPRSKLYRLGPALIRYANLREQAFPAKRAAAEHLKRLVDDVRETAHVTELQGTMLSPVYCQDSLYQSTRVHVNPTEMLPLHATSSGKVVLAFSDDDLLKKVLAAPMPTRAGNSAVQGSDLKSQVFEARKSGFGRSDGEYEKDVSSIAAPLFGGDGRCIGAVSVVCPTARMDADLGNRVQNALKIAAHSITQAWGGEIPDHLKTIWGNT